MQQVQLLRARLRRVGSRGLGSCYRPGYHQLPGGLCDERVSLAGSPPKIALYWKQHPRMDSSLSSAQLSMFHQSRRRSNVIPRCHALFINRLFAFLSFGAKNITGPVRLPQHPS